MTAEAGTVTDAVLRATAAEGRWRLEKARRTTCRKARMLFSQSFGTRFSNAGSSSRNNLEVMYGAEPEAARLVCTYYEDIVDHIAGRGRTPMTYWLMACTHMPASTLAASLPV